MSAIGSGGTGYPAVKFQNPGDNHWGTIVDIRDMQATDFKTRQPLKYPDGNPVLQTVLTIQKSDEQFYRIFVKAGAMRSACQTAVTKAEASDVELGGVIKLTFLGMEPAKGGGERKAFNAQYKKPAPGWVPPVMTQPEPEVDTFAQDDEPPF
jgi:hypothetical protein